jgi:surface carbohydrate biosynthesis protein (TIGR04326 family)
MYNPNYVGANSKEAGNIFKVNGFEENQIKSIEAQRFNYLNEIVAEENNSNNLLITTSIGFEETKELLTMFASSYKMKYYDMIFVRSHPYLPVESIIKEIEDFPAFTLSQGSMKEVFSLCNTVLTTNSSSVLLESLLNLKKTITLYSLKTLPMPAVEKHDLLHMVTSAHELSNTFVNIQSIHSNQFNTNFKPLYLGKELVLWKKFIDV